MQHIILSDVEVATGALDVLLSGVSDVSDVRDVPDVAASPEGPRAVPGSFPGPWGDGPALPMDEGGLIRIVSRPERERARTKHSSHRSSAQRARTPLAVPLVDPILSIHLAHRTLVSDAPVRLDHTMKALRNAVIAACAAGKPPFGLAPLRDGTLGAALGTGAKSLSLAQNIPWLSPGVARPPGYVASTFEIEFVAGFLGVDVVVHGGAEVAGRGSAGRLTVGRLAGRKHPTLVLVRRADGRGHDLLLAPAPSGGTMGGHVLLFRSPQRP